MSNLVRDILDYSRIGRTKLDNEDVDIVALVKEIMAGIDPEMKVSVEFSGEFPVISAPRLFLFQTLQNLLSNAIKYNDKNKPEIKISGHENGSYFEISISDNGPGIDPKYHERIFGIFQTLDSEKSVEGTGVGLAIVKKTIAELGGEVTVDSEKGKGATFTLSLPSNQAKRTQETG